MRPVRKAVFPVAGLGTRFLPATKAVPKEMLTVVDRPIIQIVVDEAREAGIEHFIFVTGRHKSVIEDHFDKQFELETILERRNKTEALHLLTSTLPEAGQASFTRQQEPLGLGHAIWCARHLVGNEPFAVLLPDMIMDAEPGCLKQMMDVYANTGGNVVAVEEKPWEDLHRYGVVGGNLEDGDQFPISSMVEKPPNGKAPSNLILSGRYILQPEIFEEIARLEPGAGNEIQLTDAMRHLLTRQHFSAWKFHGETHDCGDKIGFLAANILLAIKQPDLASDLMPILRRALAEIEAAQRPAQGRPTPRVVAGTQAFLSTP